LWRRSQSEEGWFLMMLKASETGLIPESEIALARRKVFAFRRVSVELFGSWLHVKPPI
jgi:hypothetical protein